MCNYPSFIFKITKVGYYAFEGETVKIQKIIFILNVTVVAFQSYGV